MIAPLDAGALERAAERVRTGVAEAARRLEGAGAPLFTPSGRLLRPLVAYAGADVIGDDATAAPGFWSAALAVQLAHEASLVHDDVIDGARTRRGVATVVARQGVAAAIVQGDHLLTAAYRAAALAGHLGFCSLSARAVERTVAGERRQAAPDARESWREIALGKAGELFGCALAAGAVLGGSDEVDARFELGRRVGLVYQMLDDLLDYCPSASTGKPALADYDAAKWTWPLGYAGALAFGETRETVLVSLFAATSLDAPSPMRAALAALEDEIDAEIRAAAAMLGPRAPLLPLLEEWRVEARAAVTREEDSVLGMHSPRVAALASAPRAAEWGGYIARHSKSFRFASSLLPEAERERITAVYAWCRQTDNLVDLAASNDATVVRRLDAWLARSRAAYDGERTGIELLDRVMTMTREAGVPFTYPAELVAGMRMDLRFREYADMPALQLYLQRAAGTVGLWLAELNGVREAWALDRAAALGRAMQLTNIVRDVGEDWERGRLYLPLDRLRAHGVSPQAIAGAQFGVPLPAGWAALLEEMMAAADRDYDYGLEGLPALPPAFRRSVAVAAAVYRGIHDAVRRNDHDTVRRRAATTTLDKIALGTRALRGERLVRSAAPERLDA